MRWIIRFFVFLVVVIGIAIVGLLMIPGERIAKIAKEQFEAATGRPIEISPDVSTTIWPVLGVRTGRVEIANAPWSDNGPMLAADELLVGVNALSLLSGNIDIRRIEAISPEVLLEVRSDGTPNWAFEGVTATGGTSSTGGDSSTGAIPAFTVGKGIVSHGSVRWLDHQTGTDIALNDVNMELRLPDFNGEGSLQLDLTMNGVKQVLDAKVAEFGPFLNGAVTSLTADLSVGGSTAGFNGRGGWLPLSLEGQINADLDDMASVYKTADMAPAAVPYGFGQAIKVSGNLTVTEQQTIHLRGATLTLDQNSLTGDVDVALAGDRPNITANLAANALDFSSLAASSNGAAPANGASGGTGWSRDVIDASFLSTANARVNFRADSIDLGTLKLGATRTSAVLDNSRIEFTIDQIAAYQGAVAGNFVMNNRNGLSMGGNLNFSQIALQPTLSDLAGYERLIGNADFQLSFLAIGNNMHDIMNGLSGSGRFAIGQGELRGLDLAGMLRNLDLSYEGEGQKTIFNEAGASFTIDGGVLHNDDLAFVADRIRADGAGRIGLGAQTLDYRITPAAFLAGDESQGITVPVIIEGTWADPKFRPDLQALIDQNLAEEKAALEARLAEERAAAEARLQQEREELEARAAEKLEEELGVTQEEGEDLGDTLRRGLENEARDALRGLLGGN